MDLKKIVEDAFKTGANVHLESKEFVKKTAKEYAKQQIEKLNKTTTVISLQECKEQWAYNYGKTWKQVLEDYEYGLGLSKIYSFEHVLDMVAELYYKQQK